VLAYAGLDAFDRRQWLTPPAARAWRRMREAARAEDVELQLVSAYRSVIYQTVLVQRKLARGLSLDQILQVNAAPGYSEHHSGRAIDVTTPGCAPAEEVFETTPAFAWLTAHADAFGFRLSYPRDNPHGILYEPWHWCLRRSPYPCERFTGSPLG
jgi:D-alanyl-D-alanine carboxypeptidase